MRKASIQLSTNFIVVMVLTITVLGFGFAIFGEIFSKVPSIVDVNIDDKCERYLDLALSETDIAFCESTIEAERGEQAVAWLGVVNTYDNDACYRLEVESISSESGDDSLTITTLEKVIPTKQADHLIVGVDSSEAEVGTYAVTLKVLPLTQASCGTNEEFGVEGTNTTIVTRKLFVKVQ